MSRVTIVRPPSRAAAPAGGSPTPPLFISGGENEKVASLIRGKYLVQGENHGKPIYAKTEQIPTMPDVTVLMYFWDDRDGPSQSGWWIGPEVGGDIVWALNSDTASFLPPTKAWQVPWDSPADSTVVLKIGEDAAPAPKATGPIRIAPKVGAKAAPTVAIKIGAPTGKGKSDGEAEVKGKGQWKDNAQNDWSQDGEAEVKGKGQWKDNAQNDWNQGKGDWGYGEEDWSDDWGYGGEDATSSDWGDVKGNAGKSDGKGTPKVIQVGGKGDWSSSGKGKHSGEVWDTWGDEPSWGEPSEDWNSKGKGKPVAVSAESKLAAEQLQKELLVKKQEEEKKKKEDEEREKKRAFALQRAKEEETKKQEQQASLIVRKVIITLKKAQDKDVERLKKEVESLMLEHVDAMGQYAVKVFAEAEKEILAAEARVTLNRTPNLSATIGGHEKDPKVADEPMDEEEEALRVGEKVRGIVLEVLDLMAAAGEKVSAAAEEAKRLSPDGELGEDGAPEETLQAVEASTKVVSAAQAALDDASKVLYDKATELGKFQPEHVRSEIQPLFNRLASNRRSLAVVQQIRSTASRRANRKAIAGKRLAELKEQFLKYLKFDVEGEMMRRSEIATLAKEEYDIDVADEELDRMYLELGLEPGTDDGVGDTVSFELFPKLRSMVVQARSWAQERKMKAAQLERERQRAEEIEKLQAEKAAKRESAKQTAQAFETLTQEAVESISSVAVTADRCTSARMALIAGTSGTDSEADRTRAVTEAVAEVEDAAGVASAAVELVGQRAIELEEMHGMMDSTTDETADREVEALIGSLLQRYREQSQQLKERLKECTDVAQETRGEMARQSYGTLNMIWMSAVCGMCKQTGDTASTWDQMFEKACAGEKGISQSGFEELVLSLPAGGFGATEESGNYTKLTAEQAQKLFVHLSGGADVLSKELFQTLVKIYFQVVKPTVLTEGHAVASKATIRLQDTECVEALEGPSRDDVSKILRVKCRRLGDKDSEGWATIVGNQGTPFLKLCSRFLLSEAEMSMTKGSPKDSREARRIVKGEAVEVLERGMSRMKCKALSDGAIGWMDTEGKFVDMSL